MHGISALWSAGLCMILSLAAGHLTEEQKSIIVDMHNDLRSRVQPAAAFMQNVVWDETLRLVAEGYAAKCIWDHNPEVVTLTLGENLFVSTRSLNVTKAMLAWFEEHLDYDFESDSCAEDKMCGHYTQMVWADSNRIGCAAHLCDTLEGLDFEKAALLVCNYFPQGNVEGQKPYEAGQWCSSCPEHLPACEHNICVAENFFPSEEPKSEATEHPAVSTNQPTVPPDPVQEPTTVPEELVEGPRRIKETDREVMQNGAEEQRTLSALLLLSWILAALILR